MQGIHARPFKEENLAALQPKPLSAEDKKELLTMLTRKCGDAPAVSQLARELRTVMLDTISPGNARQTGAATGAHKDRLLVVAYQLVLPVRYVRVAAAAVVAASQSFVLFDTASNTQLTRSLLAPAALGDALCAALLRPKVRTAFGDDCLIRAAMMAFLACCRGGRVTDAPNVLMSSFLSKLCAVLLEQDPGNMPQSITTSKYLVSAIISGLAPQNERPEWPRVQEETVVDVLVWVGRLWGTLAEGAAGMGQERRALAASDMEAVRLLMGNLLPAAAARFSAKPALAPAAARKVQQLFVSLSGHVAPSKMAHAQTAALMYLGHELHAKARSSLPKAEEYQQLESRAARGAEILAAAPRQLRTAGDADCLTALTGILRVIAIHDKPTNPASNAELPPARHAAVMASKLLAPLMEQLASWICPSTQADAASRAAVKLVLASPGQLCGNLLIDQV